jgi:hypothetical protein
MLPFKGNATSTNPRNFCGGAFEIPKCGDGIYSIIVNIAVSDFPEDVTLSIVVLDGMQLFSNKVASMRIHSGDSNGNLTILYPLQAGNKVYAQLEGSVRVLGSSTTIPQTYLNLTRVA